MSLKLHLKLVGSAWWTLAVGAAATVIGVLTDIWSGIEVPAWVWLGLGIAALVAAQFIAFHRLHSVLVEERPAASVREATLKAEINTPYQFVVKTLSSSFSMHTFRPPLETTDRGLAIRCVLGTLWEEPLELDSQTKIVLRKAIGGSDLETWLTDVFGISPVRSWSLTDPTNQWIATVTRGSVDLGQRSFSLDGQATLEIPLPPSKKGWIGTVVDIAIRKQSDQREFLFDAAAYCEFTDVLIRATKQVHDECVARLIPEADVETVGPVVDFHAHSMYLDEFLEYSDWERAAGAGSTSFHTIDAGDEDRTSREDRWLLITEGLRQLLAREGFIGFEGDIDRFQRRGSIDAEEQN